MTFEAGRKLGPYEIVEQAGVGGMGEVYKALFRSGYQKVGRKSVCRR